jgi:hypothetical protein
MTTAKSSTRKPAYEKKNSYSAEAWRKRKAERNQVTKIKPGTMAALMFPGKTHFTIEFGKETKE